MGSRADAAAASLEAEAAPTAAAAELNRNVRRSMQNSL
jgi:hypothetical protein